MNGSLLEITFQKQTKGIHCVQHETTTESQQELPPALVLLQSNLTLKR